MKRLTIFLSLMLMASLVMGGNEMYYKKMGETLGQFASCKTSEDFQNLANQFRVIANVETEEWLPLYYETQCYILIGFINKLDVEERDSFLDKASSSLDLLIEKAPGEAEVYALQAFCYTAQMLINPAERSKTTSPLIYSAIGKALAIEPNNPRAMFLRISNEIGTASFFGSDTSPFCEQAADLLESWGSYELKSPLHPQWGRQETEGIVKRCGR
jgi:hypothetical protein